MSPKDSSGIPPQPGTTPRWIATPYCAVNLSQVCRIEYHRSDISRQEINGLDLWLVDRTTVTLEQGENGFEQVVAELRKQGIEVAVEGEVAGEWSGWPTGNSGSSR